MIHFKPKTHQIIFLSFFCAFTASCQEDKPPTNASDGLKEQLNASTNSFFSEEIFDDSSQAQERDLPCPGANESQQKDLNHPQVIRGSVVAPRVHASSSFSFINRAYAVPIGGEFVVAKVKIDLVVGFKDHKVVNTTTTDALGRFCLTLPSNDLFTEQHFLEAKVGEERLRRLSPNQKNAVVSTQSEAVFRLYQSHYEKLSSGLEKGRIINLQTMADTRVDTLRPLQAKSTIEETVVWILEDLKRDSRILAWMRKK